MINYLFSTTVFVFGCIYIYRYVKRNLEEESLNQEFERFEKEKRLEKLKEELDKQVDINHK